MSIRHNSHFLIVFIILFFPFLSSGAERETKDQDFDLSQDGGVDDTLTEDDQNVENAYIESLPQIFLVSDNNKVQSPLMKIKENEIVEFRALRVVPKGLNFKCPNNTSAMATGKGTYIVYLCIKPSNIVNGPMVFLTKDTNQPQIEANVVEGKFYKFVIYYKNRKKHVEYSFNNGLLHGNQTAWFENGQKSSIAVFINGKLVDLLSWYKNGNKEFEYSFNNGLLHGNQTTWFENGQKDSVTVYNNGKLLDIRTWYKNGNKKEITTIKDHQVDTKIWNQKGKLLKKPRLSIHGLSPFYSKLVKNDLDTLDAVVVLNELSSDIQLSDIKIQFDGLNVVYLTYFIRATKGFQALQNDAYLDVGIIQEIDKSLLPTTTSVASLLGAVTGYGGLGEPRLDTKLRIVGGVSSVEIELSCADSDTGCGHFLELECFRHGKKKETVFPQNISDSLFIGPSKNIGGKITENKCFWDVWK